LKDRGLDLKSIERIFITHGHIDHFGAARELQRRTGAHVLIHEEDLLKVTAPYRLVEGNAPPLEQTGIPPEIISTIAQIELVMGLYSEPLEQITTFTGDDILEFDRFSLEVIHLPGHSSGHTALYWPEKESLISGDLLLPNITTIPVVEYGPSSDGEDRCPSLKQMLESLHRLSSLELEQVFPGHGFIIDDPGALIDERILFYEQRLVEVYTLLKTRGPQNAYELALAYFKRLEGFDILLAVCEIIVNLDLLIHRGRVQGKLNDGVFIFKVRS
jgi:glyoxylase-like metal-dependent hydrolase (beta-lactamase superfamily II)